MRLFIAEKPSLGRAIAQYLPTSGRPVGSPATHLVCGGDVVTWCFGHLLEMAEPESYGPEFKRWAFDALPIIPERWMLEPKKSAQAQIKVIRGLLRECSEVVNAGDPDREGQLLVDELLEHLGNRRPVKRLWLAALDEASVRKALAGLADNARYANLKAAAEARQRGDWLVGMNLSRAYTLAGRARGHDGVLSIGRVQTPTLALVVNRCLAIEDFKPVDFFTVEARVATAPGAFIAAWKPGEAVPVDEAGRVLDRRIAEVVRAKVEGGGARVTKFEAKDKEQAPPLPHSLSSLQQAANQRHGLGAQAVLDTAQQLYEAQLTTYPRTDCSHLPESQWAEAGRILRGLPSDYADLTRQADPALRSPAWNDAKISAHHAIVPTGQAPQDLTERQRQVYDLIVRAYLAQFFPPFRYRDIRIELDLSGEPFAANGSKPLAAGWKIVYGGMGEQEGDAPAGPALPTLKAGDTGRCESAEVVAKKTTPPAYFTEGTLIAAMTRIHQWVDDPELKRRLKETAGLGTEATRAGIIETLKKRNFIAEKGRQLRDTPTGRSLIQALPEPIKSPGLTGLFEQLLKGIEEGGVPPQRFMEQQIGFVRKYVALAQQEGLAMAPSTPALACPVCGEGRLRRIKGGKGFFWGCSRFQEGCRATFPDRAGKAVLARDDSPREVKPRRRTQR
ncbi:DNA topoisomerase III [Methylomagnum sp.]